MYQAYLNSPNSQLFIIDPEREYKALAIKLKGTVSDNIVLTDLYLLIDGMTGLSTSTKVATYDKTNGKWKNAAGTADFAKVGVLGTNGYEFDIDTDSNEFDIDNGHSVNWTLVWDTAMIDGVADTNIKVQLTAHDNARAAGHSVNGVATDYNTTATRQVDVVPYITKLYTSISASAGEEFARSATGKYIVRGRYSNGGTPGNRTYGTETVRLFGYNLVADPTDGNVTIASTENIKTTASTAAETTKYKGFHLKFPIGTGTNSGKLSIIVNEVESLNNVNASPEFEDGGIEPTEDSIAMYNSQANGKTSNRLTDDVDLWVWDMSNFLDKTNITSPMLKMDKAGSYYMSYGNGVPDMFVNKNGTERSIDMSYNKFHNTNVQFDDNGNIYAVATNTDRIGDKSARFVFYTPYSNTQNNQWPQVRDVDNYSEANNGADVEYRNPTNYKRHLELAFNSATGIYDINRVKIPKITSYTNGAKTNIGIAYYDYNNTIHPVKVRF